MLDKTFLEVIRKRQLLPEDELTATAEKLTGRPVFIRNDLNWLLYGGILALTSGIGMLLYKNIDTLGHSILILLTAASALLCLYFGIKNQPEDNINKNHPTDYLILGGSILLVSFIAYWQYQYNIFGTRYGLATFIPMIMLFAIAYKTNHKGVLSMAIINLCAWLGISVTSRYMVMQLNFDNDNITIAGVLLGIALGAYGRYSAIKKWQSHFSFTYENFGFHILFLSLLRAIVQYEFVFLLWALLLGAFAFMQHRFAIKEQSFYKLFFIALYSYIANVLVIFRILDFLDFSYEGITLFLIVQIALAIAVGAYLYSTHKKMKQ
ncbi:DUF2157 domain-containing protein [Polluticaenibacter yanchengensis]|uniref:DUF2157 domain-containing protein n=1 Tax=Polluticaenibacter yanchengensis TaxID=3014562 RepID=A0ABT4UF59_9BACT|nr:DUF2157 domain-containing protein [Chitinophagaceae bacterium LY-5]